MITQHILNNIGGLTSMVMRVDEAHALTDDQFFRLCQENKNLRFERTKEGDIVVMTPTGLETSGRNSDLNLRIGMWNLQAKFRKVFDSNGGFTLPDGSVFAPDAAVVSQARWDTLPKAERKKFGRVCPEFIVELKSESDRIATLQDKMKDWLNNGVQLGWLIDPDTETVYIYEAGKTITQVNGFDNVLSGGQVLPGFELDLKILR